MPYVRRVRVATTPRHRLRLLLTTPRRRCGVTTRKSPGAHGPPEVDRRGRGSRSVAEAQPMNSESSLSSAAFGLAPTIDFTTSPPW